MTLVRAILLVLLTGGEYTDEILEKAIDAFWRWERFEYQGNARLKHRVSVVRVIAKWKLTRPSYSAFCASFQASRSCCSMRRFTSASHSSAILLAAALESWAGRFFEEEAIGLFKRWWRITDIATLRRRLVDSESS